MIAAALLALLTIPGSFAPSAVEIESTAHVNATDVRQPAGTRIRCRRSGAAWKCRGGSVNAGLLRAVLRELRIPSPQGDVAIAGFDEARIARISSELARRVRNDRHWTTQERAAALTMTTAAAVRSAIYASFYPTIRSRAPVSARVLVRMSDAEGHTVSVESRHPTRRMLPWTIAYDGVTASTIDAHLSRLIALLLPASDANRSRLDEHLADPASLLMTEIDFRVIACRYDEDPRDRKFCALTRAKTSP